MQGYEDFLGAYASDPLAKRVRVIVAARREAITWRRSYRTDTPNAYWSYLQRYPRGPHATDARRRLAILTAPLEPPPTFDVIDYDVPPPPPDEFAYIDRPVLAFGDPEFDFVPPPPVPVFFLPPPPDDFIVLPPPPLPVALFILPQPIFVPIPVYVRAPVYVAAPPNNIIFANIHNRAVINNVINRPPQPGLPGVVPGVKAGARANGAVVAPAVTVAPGQGGATPVLPPAVAQKASLIQQGKLPMPPSAAINPAVKTGLPGAPAVSPNATQPANAPNVLAPNQSLPRTNALPVPGARGAPPAPPSAVVSPPGAEACAGRNASGFSGPANQARGPPSGRLLLQPRPDRRDLVLPGPHQRRRHRRTLPQDHGSLRRRPAPPRRRGRPLPSRRNLSCSPKFDVRRRHLPRCRRRGRRRLPALRHRLRHRGWRRHRPGSPPRRRLGWPRRRHPHRGWLHRRLASPRQRRRPGWQHPRRGRPRRLQRRQPRGARRTFRNADCLG